MDAATGYAEAKCLLKRHFGNDFKITTAYVEKALNWSVIRPDDGKALHSYALYLRSCSNAAQNFQYTSELDLPPNVKQIVSKLPYKLGERWRTMVCDIMEQTLQRPSDLVIFVEKQSKIMQDPVFGDIKDVRKETKVRAPTVNLPYGKSTSKQSFATTVSPITTNAVVKALSMSKKITIKLEMSLLSMQMMLFPNPAFSARESMQWKHVKHCQNYHIKRKLSFLRNVVFVLPV